MSRGLEPDLGGGRTRQRRVVCVLGGASLAMVAGSFLPWAQGLSARASSGWNLHLTIRPSGMTLATADGAGGLHLVAGLGPLAGGILLGAVALYALVRGVTLGAKLLAVVAATLTAIDVGAVARILTAGAGDAAGPSYGLGVTVAGAVVAFLAVATLLIQLEPDPGEGRLEDARPAAGPTRDLLGDVSLPADPMATLARAIAGAQVGAGTPARHGRPVMTHIAIATTDADGAGVGYVVGVVPTEVAGDLVAAVTHLLRMEAEVVEPPVDTTAVAFRVIAPPRPRRGLRASVAERHWGDRPPMSRGCG
jgi:hypothetical protein